MCGDKAFGDLPEALGELKKLVVSAKVGARAHAEDAVANWRKALKVARERIVHALLDQPWKSMAIVGATGFLLGLASRTHRHTWRSW